MSARRGACLFSCTLLIAALSFLLPQVSCNQQKLSRSVSRLDGEKLSFFSSTFLFQAAESWRLLTPAASYPTPIQAARVCLKGDQLQLQELISLVIFVKDTFGNKLQSFKIFLIFCNTKKT